MEIEYKGNLLKKDSKDKEGMKVVKKNLVFRKKGTEDKLLTISEEGSFPGEIKNTIGLLAYEQGVEESDIEVVKE